MISIVLLKNNISSGKFKKYAKCYSSRHTSRKSFQLTVLWCVAKFVKSYHRIIFTPTPRRSQSNGIVERAVRRIKEGTSAVLLQSGLDEKWWADSFMEYEFYASIVQDFLYGRRNTTSRKAFLENQYLFLSR